MKKTILITGASRGFGKIWANAFLRRGDNVIATARNLNDVDDLVKEYGASVLPVQLDVTDREQCFSVVNQAYQHFGVLDVVINNAGYGLIGMVEEIDDQEARRQFDTNFFGTLWVTQAVIPVMRRQGRGHIIQVSSTLGLVAVPLLGLYNASKWAVEALSESMHAELTTFGINTTIVEPGEYATGFSGPLSAAHSKPIGEYDGMKAALYAKFTEVEFGNPEATAGAILMIVDAAHPPLRILFGKVLPWLKQVYAERLLLWDQWNELSEAAHG